MRRMFIAHAVFGLGSVATVEAAMPVTAKVQATGR